MDRRLLVLHLQQVKPRPLMLLLQPLSQGVRLLLQAKNLMVAWRGLRSSQRSRCAAEPPLRVRILHAPAPPRLPPERTPVPLMLAGPELQPAALPTLQLLLPLLLLRLPLLHQSPLMLLLLLRVRRWRGGWRGHQRAWAWLQVGEHFLPPKLL